VLDLGRRRIVRLHRFAQAQGANSKRVRRDHVAVGDQQQFSTAAADLHHHGAGLNQGRFVPQVGLHPQVRHAGDFRFVNRIDHQSRSDVDPVDERQPITRFPHRAGGHHTHMLRDLDSILLDDVAVGAEHPDALLHRGFADDVVGERVLAQADRLGECIERAHAPRLADLADGHPDRGRADVDHGDGPDGRRLATPSCFGQFRVHVSLDAFSC